MSELVIKSKLKEKVQENGFKLSADLYVAVSDKIELLIIEATQRAEANGRKTVLVRDL